jgi:hypothetical protein
LQTTVERRAEFLVGRVRRGRESAHDHLAAAGQQGETLPKQVAKAALDPMTGHGVADRTSDHEGDSRRREIVGYGSQGGIGTEEVEDQQ